MGKVAIIVGASSGIGLECAKGLLDRGYIVCNCSRRNAPDERILNYSVDVSDSKAIDVAVNDILKLFNCVDILIYSAGFSMAARIENIKPEDYRYLFDVNLFGAIHIINRIIPSMKKYGGGRILTISSIGSISPIPYDPYYCASKAALDMLAITLNTELNAYNIFVTSVLPGGTKTNFTFMRKIYPESDPSMYNAVNALGIIEQRGMSAKAVADTVIKAATSNKPKAIVSAGLINKGIYSATKLIPKRYLIKITRKVFKTY